MQKVKLEITGIAYSQTQSGSYVLTLLEVGGKRKLPIVIGGFEAQAIAVALENMHPSRPLTHDLMKNFMTAFNLQLQEVYICDLQEGIFYSKLVCHNSNDTIEIDSRTSDALALAVRFGCPVYVYEHILDQAGLANEKSDKVTMPETITKTSERSDLAKLSIAELNQLLSEVLEQEDYIRAIDIRDEINKRNEPKQP